MTATFHTFTVSFVNRRTTCNTGVVVAEPEIFHKKICQQASWLHLRLGIVEELAV